MSPAADLCKLLKRDWLKSGTSKLVFGGDESQQIVIWVMCFMLAFYLNKEAVVSLRWRYSHPPALNVVELYLGLCSAGYCSESAKEMLILFHLGLLILFCFHISIFKHNFPCTDCSDVPNKAFCEYKFTQTATWSIFFISYIRNSPIKMWGYNQVNLYSHTYFILKSQSNEFIGLYSPFNIKCK